MQPLTGRMIDDCPSGRFTKVVNDVEHCDEVPTNSPAVECIWAMVAKVKYFAYFPTKFCSISSSLIKFSSI